MNPSLECRDIFIKTKTSECYQYDEWGNILQSSETVSNPFKYAGEVYDEVQYVGRTNNYEKRHYKHQQWKDPTDLSYRDS